ncbi:MAG: response regulator [Hyphomicrobiales bacterium]|nr:response regulator [Hyphomicrobiales bacterium]
MTASVLIVEHDPNMAHTIGFLMRRCGLEVRLAADGEAALAAARQRAPDLVLTGVTLPGPSGYDVCRALRGEPACARTRIVFVTACARPVDREKALALGADDYVTKPFAGRDLVARVQALLGGGG